MNSTLTPSRTARRRLLFALAGSGALAAGLGLAAQKERKPPGLSPEAQAFWAARLPRLAGGEDLAAASLRGRPLLVNFWATWCPPCIKELPEINQFYKESQAAGWQVLGIAVDQPGPVAEFLKKLPLDFTLALAGNEGIGLTRKLGNAPGGLPFSVAFDAGGEIIWRRLGATQLAELRQIAKGQASR